MNPTLALSIFDDKRYILDDGINTRSHGNLEIVAINVKDIIYIVMNDVSSYHLSLLSNSINRGR